MKIGKLVRSALPDVFEFIETNDPEELERLMDPTYSKQKFDLNFPFCLEQSAIIPEMRVRYWKDVYSVCDRSVRVCSQWYEPHVNKNRQLFEQYLAEKGISHEKAVGFTEAVRRILRNHPEGLTPQQVVQNIQSDYPQLYDTETQREHVSRGHYKDIYQACLATVYTVARGASDIDVDKATSPQTLALVQDSDLEGKNGEAVEAENIERLAAGVGVVYVLNTGLYTQDGRQIIKIGITSGSVDSRIRQLDNTSVPMTFSVLKTYEFENYAELEQALHKLLDPFRINRKREFFTDECLPYLQRIVEIHDEIIKQSEGCRNQRGKREV